MKNCCRNKVEGGGCMEEITKEVEKHKKAIAYAFFDTNEKLELMDIIVEKESKNILALLIFDQGRKVIYESGGLFLECGFQKYMSWFNQNVNKYFKNYVKDILVYDKCGFIEYIDETADKEKNLEKEYFLRYGSLIAIVLSINGNFLSMSSIKRKKQYPVIQNILPILKEKVKYVEPVSVEIISEQMKGSLLKKQELEWVLQSYAASETFIRKNVTDIKELIAMSFKGEKTC